MEELALVQINVPVLPDGKEMTVEHVSMLYIAMYISCVHA